MQFAFEVAGSAVELSPVNGNAPRPVSRSYTVVGHTAASAQATATQLFLSELAAAGLRPAGELTVAAA